MACNTTEENDGHSKMTEMMVLSIIMAVLKSASHKTARSYHSLPEEFLEVMNQCGESTLKDQKPASLNHGKGSCAGQLTPVKHSRLTTSKTVTIDEPAGGYIKMMETQPEDIY